MNPDPRGGVLSPSKCSVALAFLSLISSPRKATKSQKSFFVKELVIPEVHLPVSSQNMTLALPERGLIGHLTRIWPSHKSMAI